MLVGVVEGGTALQADLSTYVLAGKTGTPRATVGGRYQPGHYNPNFAGLFPADAPQFVIVVKLSDPTKSIFGGQTAAPLTKTIIEAALASKGAALDLGKLASSVRAPARPAADAAGDAARSVTLAGANASESVAASATSPVSIGNRASCAAGVRTLPAGGSFGEGGRVVVRLAAPDGSGSVPAPQEVPAVAGLSLRDAVRELHCAGFRVEFVRASAVGPSSRVVARVTVPAAGARVPAGTLVRLTVDH